MRQVADTNGHTLIRSWASDIDEGTIRQAMTSARSDAVSGPIALMPDAHIGMGATIGSVIPTEGAIIPAAVGVDLGCGMIAVRTNLTAGDLPDTLDPLLSQVERDIPAGFNWHDNTRTAAGRWLETNPLPDADHLTSRDTKKIGPQLGTLGGGNHFVEISLDETDRVWCVLHSGSRGIGNRLATGHIAGARQLCADQQRSLEDRDLAYFLQTDEGFGRYITHMLWAQRYAFTNREIMMDALLGAVRRATDRPVGRSGTHQLPPQLRATRNPRRARRVDHPQGRHPGEGRRPRRHPRLDGHRQLHRHRVGGTPSRTPRRRTEPAGA